VLTHLLVSGNSYRCTNSNTSSTSTSSNGSIDPVRCKEGHRVWRKDAWLLMPTTILLILVVDRSKILVMTGR
jgi:hypothetical protein